MKKADKPINPVLTQSPSLQNDTSLVLTKIEYYSMLAMLGILPNPNSFMNKHGNWMRSPESIARMSIKLEDELLNQLEKE